MRLCYFVAIDRSDNYKYRDSFTKTIMKYLYYYFTLKIKLIIYPKCIFGFPNLSHCHLELLRKSVIATNLHVWCGRIPRDGFEGGGVLERSADILEDALVGGKPADGEEVVLREPFCRLVF